MRRSVLILALMCVSAVGWAQASTPDRAIRLQRTLSNAAIARHDTGGVGAAMADDIVVVTSRSTKQVGRAANLTSFADQFRTRPDVVYERTPTEVRIYDTWGMASEQGRWSGSWTDTDGKIQIGGIYFAKWRLRNGSWLIESETYVPERCSGGTYCRNVP